MLESSGIREPFFTFKWLHLLYHSFQNNEKFSPQIQVLPSPCLCHLPATYSYNQATPRLGSGGATVQMTKKRWSSDGQKFCLRSILLLSVSFLLLSDPGCHSEKRCCWIQQTHGQGSQMSATTVWTRPNKKETLHSRSGTVGIWEDRSPCVWFALMKEWDTAGLDTAPNTVANVTNISSCLAPVTKTSLALLFRPS